jgi:putative copper resistance protein D
MQPSTSALAPLTPRTALSTFATAPSSIIVCVMIFLAAVAYLAGVRRVRSQGDRWHAGRAAVFILGGLGGLAVVLLGALEVYSSVLLSVLTVQVLILLLVLPLLLALGRPFELLRLARRGPTEPGAWLRRLDNPLIAPALLPVVTGLIFFTPVLDVLARGGLPGLAVRVALTALGLLIALPLVQGGVARASVAIAAALFVGFLELLADAIPGIALRLASSPVSSVYPAGRTWGPSVLGDQHTAGSVLWVVAEIVDLPFLALLVLQWIRADEREARALDARLDAQAERRLTRPTATEPTATEATATEPTVGRGVPEDPVRERPWWEVDASVLGSERAARLRGREGGSR